MNFLGLHILTARTMDRRIERAKMEQRKMDKAMLAEMLHKNALLNDKVYELEIQRGRR